MAESPAHKWGQIVGEFLESLIAGKLLDFSQQHGLYLDSKGKRLARKGAKVSWVDVYGNTHDLDYVLERGGTDQQIGKPVAFIEIAWRRYTKHSRNKAQEIQGAIMPLVVRHQNSAPFKGVVLGGEFTSGAIIQLKSLGFNVLYFSYQQLIDAFKVIGIDAAYEENTSAEEFRRKIGLWESLNQKQKDSLGDHLLNLNWEEVTTFFYFLEKSITRFIVSVKVIPLHGLSFDFADVLDAMEHISTYVATSGTHPIIRYEIHIEYNNGDQIESTFQDKQAAMDFLESYGGPRAEV